MRSYSGPHVSDATDKRATIQPARHCQEVATPMPETLIPNDGANWWEQLQKNVYAGAKELWQCVQQHVHLSTDKIQPQELKPTAQYKKYRHPSVHRPRQFEACVFCALQFWTEELDELFIAGPKCFMQSPASVAALLDS